MSSPYLLHGDCVQRFYSHASKLGNHVLLRESIPSWSVSTAFPKVFQTTTGFFNSPKFTPTKQESIGGAAHKKDVTKSQKWVSGVVPIPPAANLR